MLFKQFNKHMFDSSYILMVFLFIEEMEEVINSGASDLESNSYK